MIAKVGRRGLALFAILVGVSMGLLFSVKITFGYSAGPTNSVGKGAAVNNVLPYQEYVPLLPIPAVGFHGWKGC